MGSPGATTELSEAIVELSQHLGVERLGDTHRYHEAHAPSRLVDEIEQRKPALTLSAIPRVGYKSNVTALEKKFLVQKGVNPQR